jgi:succinylglutamate desuccinylase
MSKDDRNWYLDSHGNVIVINDEKPAQETKTFTVEVGKNPTESEQLQSDLMTAIANSQTDIINLMTDINLKLDLILQAIRDIHSLAEIEHEA